jgi:hypothetical protein
MVQRQEALVSRGAAACAGASGDERDEKRGRMKARLNFFQATMLRWRELHPYSAVHVVRVDGALDPTGLTDAVRGFLGLRGLSGLELDRRAGRYQWHGGPSQAAVAVLDDSPDAAELLRGEIERQLNLRFASDGRFEPFRFFAVRDDGAFWLGVVYDHFVAGGDSIADLLRGVVDFYREGASQALLDVRLHPPSYRPLFLRQAGAIISGLRKLPALAAACKRSLRPHFHDHADGHTGFRSFRLDDAECAALLRAGTDWAVTQNDIFLGVLLKSLSAHGTQRRREKQRRELGVASIVNIRRDFGTAWRASFGPVLASFRFSHEVPDGVGLRELVSAVNEETLRIKRGKIYLQSLMALALVSAQWRFLTLDRRQRLFGKHYPVWAGTTPLNVSPAWHGAAKDGRCPDYIRAVPTGPLAPISIAVTTSGSNVHVGVSFRTTAFDATTIAVLVADIRKNINRLQSPP